MPAYLALAQRLFTSDANVRNVKAFFSIKRAKFEPRLPLERSPGGRSSAFTSRRPDWLSSAASSWRYSPACHA